MRREVANLQTLATAGGAVPRVLDHNTSEFEDTKTELYVVMDLIEGPTLTEYVRKHGRLTIDQALQFTLSLCKLIKVAHTFPILHRDLKPDNIIVQNATASELVVVDYGLSFNASDEALTETNEAFRNQFLDLPETNTPSGDRRDPRSDLTAACAVLYFCLTGHVPGQLQDASGTLPHLRDGFSLREHHTGDNRVQSLDEFLTRGFAPAIANRFQTVEEIQTRLESLLSRNTDFDPTDPIQLAAVLSRQIRDGDRTTKIAEFRKAAEPLLKHINAEASKYADKLGGFQVVNAAGGAHPNQVTLPAGLDPVLMGPHSVTLSVTHHSHRHSRKFAVASQGERCVLLAADYSFDEKKPPRQMTLTWQEIAWYEGDPKSIFSLVSISYREWIIANLRQLTNKILSSGP